MAFSHLIIGLGNPGDKYFNTRHNVGFMALDEIARHFSCAPWKKKFRSLSAEGKTETSKTVLLLKPQTYMNLSGEAAIEALRFFGLNPEQVIVFHDDLDLAPGQVKLKQGGGSGGHNGLKSLDSHIGQNYWRVRLGIGRPMTEQGDPVKGDAVTNYVLSPFSKADKNWLPLLVPCLANNIELLLVGHHKEYVAELSKN